MKPKKQYTPEELIFWREANKRSYQKHREERIRKVRAYQEAHPEKRAESCRNYYLQNREKRLAYQKKYNREHPEVKKADNLVRNYLLGSECEFCGRTEKLEHGHIDYDFPEIYLTVCHSCNMWMGKP